MKFPELETYAAHPPEASCPFGQPKFRSFALLIVILLKIGYIAALLSLTSTYLTIKFLPLYVVFNLLSAVDIKAWRFISVTPLLKLNLAGIVYIILLASSVRIAYAPLGSTLLTGFASAYIYGFKPPSKPIRSGSI